MNWVWAAEKASDSAAGSDGYWRLAMILAAIGFLGLLARWRRSKQKPPIPARELRERDQDPNKYRSASDRAMTELLEAGREITAQVDIKVRFLNRLIKDADSRIAKLEELVKQADSCAETCGETSVPMPERRQPEIGRSSGRYLSAVQERIVAMHDQGKSLSEIAKATGMSTTEINLALEHAVKTKVRNYPTGEAL